MKNPYLQLRLSGWPVLADLAWQKLHNSPHGDLARWLATIDSLPASEPWAELNGVTPALGRPVDNPDQLKVKLMQLHPWRKGPLRLCDVKIETEWRSDWKWNRIATRLDLVGHRVLDIGCGNGYFGLRMLAAGAKMVVGIDPTLVFVMQWLAMQKLSPGLDNYVLPLGIEDLPEKVARFDSVFSMGVLYHRHRPDQHLQQLKELVRPGGQIVLETLILEGAGEQVLVPEGRYCRMPNVHLIPTLATLRGWIELAGFTAIQVLDVSKTTVDEQRSTDWMTFESLGEGLDQNDQTLTIEGHPAPVRAALLIRV